MKQTVGVIDMLQIGAHLGAQPAASHGMIGSAVKRDGAAVPHFGDDATSIRAIVGTNPANARAAHGNALGKADCDRKPPLYPDLRVQGMNLGGECQVFAALRVPKCQVPNRPECQSAKCQMPNRAESQNAKWQPQQTAKVQKTNPNRVTTCQAPNPTSL